jgi:hypothetical protein
LVGRRVVMGVAAAEHAPLSVMLSPFEKLALPN